MLADIIIRGKNGHDLTEACLDSLRGSAWNDTRIILVDDGSDPPYTFDADYLVRLATSQGAVTATNVGLSLSLRHTDTNYVLIMDNDTRVPEGDETWLERMVEEIQFEPRIAAVGATTNFANPPQHILAAPQTYIGEKAPEQIWFVSFCVLLDKRIVREVGLWDERYNPGNWEDTDYALQLRSAGYKIKVARSVYIHHEGHKTFGDDLKKLLQTNKVQFVEKWGFGRLWDMGLVETKEVAHAIQQAGTA